MTTRAAYRLEADRELCHQCGVVTHWEPVRGGRRLRCVECGDVFPCAKKCAHADCEDVRAPDAVESQISEHSTL